MELDALREVFATNWLGNGPQAAEFERAFAAYVGRPAEELVAVSSCTEGIFQAVQALGIGPGDDVILPTISFVGAAHAVRSTGARVVLCDVDQRTLNPDVAHVAQALTPATKAVLPLHFGGDPGDIAGIAEFARDNSLLLIEDAAVGLGSSVRGRWCGTFGDVGVWSFDAMKPLTTGDGGMMWCRSAEVADKVRTSIRMGVGSSGFGRSGETSRWWEIDPSMLGRRAAMNDVAASIGLVQLTRLPSFLDRRRGIAARYTAAFSDLPWIRPAPDRLMDVAWVFYHVQTAVHLRDALATHLLRRGVYTNFRYWPLHRTQMYGSAGSFSGADVAAAATLLLPLHPALSDSDIDTVIREVHSFALEHDV